MDNINFDQSAINALVIIILTCMFISLCCCCCLQTCMFGKLFYSIQSLSNTINPLSYNYQSDQFLHELARIQSNTTISNQPSQELITDTKQTQTIHNNATNYRYKPKTKFSAAVDDESPLETPLPHQTSSSVSNSVAHLIPVRSSMGSVTSPKSGQTTGTPQSIIYRSDPTFTPPGSSVAPTIAVSGNINNINKQYGNGIHAHPVPDWSETRKYGGGNNGIVTGTQTPTNVTNQTYCQIPLFPAYNPNIHGLNSFGIRMPSQSKEDNDLNTGHGLNMHNVEWQRAGLIPSQMMQAWIVQMNSYLSKQQQQQHQQQQNINKMPSIEHKPSSDEKDVIVYKTNEETETEQKDATDLQTKNNFNKKKSDILHQISTGPDTNTNKPFRTDKRKIGKENRFITDKYEPDSNLANIPEYTIDTRNLLDINTSPVSITIHDAVEQIWNDQYIQKIKEFGKFGKFGIHNELRYPSGAETGADTGVETGPDEITRTMSSVTTDTITRMDSIHSFNSKIEEQDTTRAMVKGIKPEISNNYLNVDRIGYLSSSNIHHGLKQGVSNRDLELIDMESMKTLISKPDISNAEEISVADSKYSTYSGFNGYNGYNLNGIYSNYGDNSRRIKKYVQEESIDPRAELADKLANINTTYQVNLDLGRGFGDVEIDIPPSTIGSNDMVASVVKEINENNEKMDEGLNSKKNGVAQLSDQGSDSKSQSSTVVTFGNLMNKQRQDVN